MRRGQKTNAEQVVLKLRQIEVQTAQGGNWGIVAGATWQRREVAKIEQLRSPYAEGACT